MRYTINLMKHWSGCLLDSKTSSYTTVAESVGFSFVADVSSLLSPDPAVSAVSTTGAVVTTKREAPLLRPFFI
jgi:hypothetical protein